MHMLAIWLGLVGFVPLPRQTLAPYATVMIPHRWLSCCASSIFAPPELELLEGCKGKTRGRLPWIDKQTTVADVLYGHVGLVGDF